MDPNGGRPQFGLSMPKEDFMENIDNYKVNKFLDIGNNDNLILQGVSFLPQFMIYL